MTLSELIRNMPIEVAHGLADVVISDIVEDSRRVTPGCLFIARRGTAVDGRAFIDDAVAGGAAAVLTDSGVAACAPAVALHAADVPTVAALLAERFHGNPSRSLSLIGITGTNGKTTTAHVAHHLLNAAGRRCGLIGTITTDDGVAQRPSELTTPGPMQLSRLLRTMVAGGCDCCVMEVSSHALHQRRVAGLQFDVGVFTNLSGDHLDYHGTMDEYAAAKAMLFELLPADGHAIVNVDDAQWQRMIRNCAATVHQCSISTASATFAASIDRFDVRGATIRFGGALRGATAHLPLIGRHNVMNALQASAVAQCVGVDPRRIIDGLQSTAPPPGRFEPVETGDRGFTVLVDYAHTDDALDNALSALHPLVPAGGRLCVVFGCGGDRDRTKRPRMAAVACRFSDAVFITSDNPRHEDPQAIVNDVCAGVPDDYTGTLHVDVDRAAAIGKAMQTARPGDVVLIAGKGHEDYQIIGDIRRPFDDRRVAAEALHSEEVMA